MSPKTFFRGKTAGQFQKWRVKPCFLLKMFPHSLNVNMSNIRNWPATHRLNAHIFWCVSELWVYSKSRDISISLTIIFHKKHRLLFNKTPDRSPIWLDDSFRYCMADIGYWVPGCDQKGWAFNTWHGGLKCRGFAGLKKGWRCFQPL